MRGMASFPGNNRYLRNAPAGAYWPPTSGQLHRTANQQNRRTRRPARAGHVYKGSVPEI